MSVVLANIVTSGYIFTMLCLQTCNYLFCIFLIPFFSHLLAVMSAYRHLFVYMDVGNSEIFLINLFAFAGTNLKLESGSEGKPETNPHVSSENKMPESSNANSNSSSNNSSGISSSTKPAAVSSTQQVDMKLPTEVGKEEKATPTSE